MSLTEKLLVHGNVWVVRDQYDDYHCFTSKPKAVNYIKKKLKEFSPPMTIEWDGQCANDMFVLQECVVQ